MQITWLWWGQITYLKTHMWTYFVSFVKYYTNIRSFTKIHYHLKTLIQSSDCFFCSVYVLYNDALCCSLVYLYFRSYKRHGVNHHSIQDYYSGNDTRRSVSFILKKRAKQGHNGEVATISQTRTRTQASRLQVQCSLVGMAI